ncbi:MAG: class I SAM-dependent methyltransferase [Bacillota bacterium]
MVFGKIDEKFNQVANDFDNLMSKIIPDYNLFQETLVNVLPFEQPEHFRVIDLGCGTGNLGRKILTDFPNAEIVCVDFSEEMLRSAEAKIGKERAVFIQADFNDFEFPGKFDAVISSLALHHLETDEDKIAFYRKMYAALNEGGVHLNAENVMSDDIVLQKLYIEKWRHFMQKSFSDTEIDNVWLAGYYDDDHPITLSRHAELMQAVGFRNFDVILKVYNFALLYCQK